MHKPPPPRPKMPTADDEARANHTLGRADLLYEKADDVARDWAQQHLSKEQLATWGPMDTSTNPLGDYARQLSSPGHYTLRPRVTHADPASMPLLQEGGVLDRSKIWASLQHVHYMVLGLGDWVVVPEITETGLCWRHVNPANVYAMTTPDAPGRWVGLWELRLRCLTDSMGKMKDVYTWDVWDLSDPENPSLRVYEATHDGGLGVERSAEVLTYMADGEPHRGAIVGPAYAWRYADGRPYIPHCRYTAWETGEAWNAWMFRGVYRGSLNAILFRTYSGRAALDAVGRMIITVGVKPPGVGASDAGGSAPTRRIQVTPGMWAVCDVDPGTQPMLWEVGPGQNLEILDRFAGTYAAGLGARYGLGTGEAVRSSGNPWSAAALFVTEKDRLQEAERSEPTFRDADLSMLRKVAALLRVAGLGLYPEDGYSITYTRPPPSPEMQRSQREDLDWRRKEGLISPVDAMITLNPGMSREAAAAEIIRVKVESARLNREINAAISRDAGDDDQSVAESTALNGAQAQAASTLLENVVNRALPPDTAIAALTALFGIPAETAARLVGSIPANFTPASVDASNPDTTTSNAADHDSSPDSPSME